MKERAGARASSSSSKPNYDDEGTTDGSSSSDLTNYGVTDGQIRTLRRMGRDISPGRVAQEVAWIQAGKRSNEPPRSLVKMLFANLRDDLPPPAEVLAERTHAERLELEHDELAKRRAEAAEARTPDAMQASRSRIAAVKERLRKGTA